MTARTPYKTKRRKTKGRASSASSKNSVSDAAELWIAPNKQFCLQPSLECRQRWRRSDIGRQTVPHASHGHRKRTVSDCWQAHHRHDECIRKVRTPSTLASKYRWHSAAPIASQGGARPRPNKASRDRHSWRGSWPSASILCQCYVCQRQQL